jgi:hypothetical protein
MGSIGAKAGAALGALGLLMVAGCNSTPGEGGMSLGSMILYGGATVPPSAPKPVDEVYCPSVDVFEGGAALQAYSGGHVGDAAALRSQIALGKTARECAGRPDGSTVVSVGVEGRALLGAGGSAGRYDVPVRIVVKHGSTVLADRVRRTTVTIPAGDTQGSFTVVEEGILVPPSAAQDFEIEVGLGGGSKAGGSRRRG